MADDKTHDALACSQTKATVGNIRSWPSSQKATVITRKESLRSARSAPCLQHVARHYPLRIVTLLSAKVNAPRARKGHRARDFPLKTHHLARWSTASSGPRDFNGKTKRLVPGSRPGFLARHRSGRANRSG